MFEYEYHYCNYFYFHMDSINSAMTKKILKVCMDINEIGSVNLKAEKILYWFIKTDIVTMLNIVEYLKIMPKELILE